MTKQDILAKVERGELKASEAMSLIEKLDRLEKKKKAPKFKVAEKSGWCSIYFDGLRYPCTLPAECWEELLEQENLTRLQNFLKENKHLFKTKE
jgi:hypothetical protein